MKFQYKCHKVTEYRELETLLNETQRLAETSGGEIVNILHIPDTMVARGGYGVIVKQPYSRLKVTPVTSGNGGSKGKKTGGKKRFGFNNPADEKAKAKKKEEAKT